MEQGCLAFKNMYSKSLGLSCCVVGSEWQWLIASNKFEVRLWGCLSVLLEEFTMVSNKFMASLWGCPMRCCWARVALAPSKFVASFWCCHNGFVLLPQLCCCLGFKLIGLFLSLWGCPMVLLCQGCPGSKI